jgi:hypothetical protein
MRPVLAFDRASHMNTMKHLVMSITLLTSFGAVWPTWAHGGEDHAEAGSAPASVVAGMDTQAPRRQPDGSVWVPKPVQHRLGLRTLLALAQPHPVAIELNGRVLADPQSGGRVQASQAGRIVAGPQGLPVLGQRVRQGQVLAYLQAAASSLDKGNQQAALAELDAQYTLAERKLARYEQLEGAVPHKDIEAARLERDALRQRRAAVRGSLNAPEALVAPVSGVVASASVVQGQVVDARDVLFEVVDPARLVVEALAYDPAQVQGLRAATANWSGSGSGGSVPLLFIGGSRQLREQALPVLFRVQQANAPLAIGQSLKVTAQTSQTVQGVAVPRRALSRNAAGETQLWLHTEAERFVPRVVQTQPLDAEQVVVTAGLRERERVVVDGASLLAQVR